MRNLFQPDVVDELKRRVVHLRPDSPRQWGKMTPGQSLAHYSAQLEMILGKTFPPRSWMGRLFGRFAKPKMLGESPLQKNMPTDELFVITGDRNLDEERERLLLLLHSQPGRRSGRPGRPSQVSENTHHIRLNSLL